MKLKIEGIGAYEGSENEATIKEISNADLDEDFDFHFESASKSDPKKYQITEIFKANKKEIQNDIRKIFDDLRENFFK
ncbi:MAG: hypothetical protein MJ252_18040 [archaeon]|nr:hypothetical protein [archaeon]